MRKFTVYYIVGRPRTGSTFVGDWIARRLGILNAGEVWQTFRTMERVETDDHARDHQRLETNRKRAAAIAADPFWASCLSRTEDDPYAALLALVGQTWDALVDCSKTDRGIDRYRALGCEVVVVHSVRAFTTWHKSLTGYRQKYGLNVPSRERLLLSYLRLNLRYRALSKKLPYSVVPQERLARIGDFVTLPDPLLHGPGYVNVEMFGAPGFIGHFDSARATQNITLPDRVLYALIGVNPGPENAL